MSVSHDDSRRRWISKKTVRHFSTWLPKDFAKMKIKIRNVLMWFPKVDFFKNDKNWNQKHLKVTSQFPKVDVDYCWCSAGGFRCTWIWVELWMLQRTNSKEIRTWLYDDILYKTWHNISSSNTGPYMCQLNTDPMKSRMGILQVILHNVSKVTCRGCD